jgi:hypothetical protein
MRVSYLFILGIIPLFPCCKTNPPFHSAGAAQYDSLKKYSYLLVGLPPKDTIHSRSPGVSTGFFIRDTNNRLFLVSAYHALTGCDPLNSRILDIRDDSLQVWYVDTLNRYKFEQFTLTAYQNKRCNDSIPDVDTMDVTGHFKDGRIFSIERMMPRNLLQDGIARGDRVICYGYHGKRPPSNIGGNPVNPSHKIRRFLGYRSEFKDKSDSLIYFTIHRALKKGFSGAPLFRIKAGSAIEFAGIQSSAAIGNKLSFVVRSLELRNLLQWK